MYHRPIIAPAPDPLALVPLLDTSQPPIPLDPPSPPPPAPRRSSRPRATPARLNDYISLDTLEHFIGTIEEGGESITLDQSLCHLDWLAAMTAEYKSIFKNSTWVLVPLPLGTHPISSCSVFKLKPNSHPPQPSIYKARIVARGNE